MFATLSRNIAAEYNKIKCIHKYNIGSVKMLHELILFILWYILSTKKNTPKEL